MQGLVDAAVMIVAVIIPALNRKLPPELAQETVHGGSLNPVAKKSASQRNISVSLRRYDRLTHNRLKLKIFDELLRRHHESGQT
jgi:hypothetical protein